MNITAISRYGALQDGFSFSFPDTGYTVLTGANNAGKSAILQLAFRTAMRHAGVGHGKAVLLLPERTYVQSSTETAGKKLEGFNTDLNGQLNGTVLSYDRVRGPTSSELPRLLLNHTSFMKQMAKLDHYLKRLGFIQLDLKGSQNIHFEDVAVQFQGSGLRGLFTILCALTDDALKFIFIDEPELSLEPKLQKALRDLLLEESESRAIVISSHSHLFLHRMELANNRIVQSSSSTVSVTSVNSKKQLHDLTFELLGNDTQDLFFPANYLIVEGVSDQIICERIVAIRDKPGTHIKVLAAGGITRVKSKLAAVEDSLTPLVAGDSPYSGRVVALIDQPTNSETVNAKELAKHLKDRLFTLPVGSIEEYLPEALYKKAGRTKAYDLERMEKLKGDFEQLRVFKKAVSEQLAGQLTQEDFDQIEILTQAVDKALKVK